MKEFRLILDIPPSGLYFPGMIVSGTVIITNDQPKDYDSIEVSVIGGASCYWSEASDDPGMYNQRHERTIKYYSACETYINRFVVIWDKQANGGGSFPAGSYTYPFSLHLVGDNLPPSYNGYIGRIEYEIEARVVKSGLLKSDHKVTEKIRVANVVPTGEPFNPILLMPAHDEVQKTICCWFCASSPIVMSVSIPRSAYCIYADAIPFEVHVENGSRFPVNVTASMNQVVHYTADEGKTTCGDHQVVASVSSGAIASRNTTTWCPDPLPVPQTETTIMNCPIVKVLYTFTISGSIAGIMSMPTMTLPLHIGNVPLEQPAANQPIPAPLVVRS